jgi:hypothetical protein
MAGVAGAGPPGGISHVCIRDPRERARRRPGAAGCSARGRGRATAGDTTPPETTIDSGPSGTTTSTSATFTFSSSEARSTFECALDGGRFAKCSSPKSYSGLALGTHTFQVRAKDAAHNLDPTPA